MHDRAVESSSRAAAPAARARASRLSASVFGAFVFFVSGGAAEPAAVSGSLDLGRIRSAISSSSTPIRADRRASTSSMPASSSRDAAASIARARVDDRERERASGRSSPHRRRSFVATALGASSRIAPLPAPASRSASTTLPVAAVAVVVALDQIAGHRGTATDEDQRAEPQLCSTSSAGSIWSLISDESRFSTVDARPIFWLVRTRARSRSARTSSSAA